MTLIEARTIIARRIAYAAIVSADVEDGWENYPDIGESDWEKVAFESGTLIVDPTEAEYEAAYALLAARSDGQEADA